MVNTYSALDVPTWLESLLRMLQGDVSVMVGPYYAVNVARHRNKEGGVRELLHGSFDYLSDLHICYLHEFLCQNRRAERELYEAVEWEVSGDACSMEGAELPCPRRR